MSIEVSGVFGLLVLIANIWAILNIVQSRASSPKKLVWIVVILLLPIIGLLLWWFVGPREKAA